VHPAARLIQPVGYVEQCAGVVAREYAEHANAMPMNNGIGPRSSPVQADKTKPCMHRPG
jgi:hypothetical protein